MSGNVMLTILRAIVILTVMVSYGCAVYFAASTVADTGLIWAAAVLVGVTAGLSGWRRWQRFTGSQKFLINFPVCAAVVTGIAAAFVFTANYVWSDSSSEKVVTADITSRYYKTRYRSQRVGRRVSGKGTPYNVYYLEVMLPDGRKKELAVTLQQYNRSRKKTHIYLKVEDGLFAMPVIKDYNLKEM